ncbi:MAG: STAS domain-containing protein [Cyanobacteriota bacterium]
MVLSTEKIDDYIIVKTKFSKINYENANKFSRQTVDLIEKDNPANLAIDLGGVTYVSSIGISALSVIKGISKINNCNLVLFNIAEEVSETLEQTGITSMFKILNTREEVLDYFKGELSADLTQE